MQEAYSAAVSAAEREQADADRAHQTAMDAHAARRAEFEQAQSATNEAIRQKRLEYEACDPGAVVDYCELVLAASSYPDFFPREFDLDYQADSRILIVDFSLPPISSMPTLKEVKYVASKDECKEVYRTEKETAALYDSLVYQVTLRTVHELFEADVAAALDAVVFNGFVTSIDSATGNEVTACIVSLQASKTEFEKINLAQVDPKACFKSLRGVGSSKLHSLTPVAPIIDVSREDRRFVDSYAVADGLNSCAEM